MSVAIADDGAEIVYETRGDGPPLVLAHGLTESRRAWDPLLDDLAADHFIVAFDHRGHGESARQPPYDSLVLVTDMHAVVRAAHVSEPFVIGHSLGGMVVTMYSSAYPVRGTINIDQPIEISGFQALLHSIEPMLRGDEASFQAVMAQVIDGLSGPLSATERSRLAAIGHPEQPVVLGLWEPVLSSNADELNELIGATAAQITKPYLALHGIDPGPAYVQWLEATVPTAAFELWPDVGHYPHLVEPDRFLQRVREFEKTL